MDPLRYLEDAHKHYPPLKYAWGLIGIAAALAIIAGLGRSSTANTIPAMVIMLVGMVVLAVLANVGRQGGPLSGPAMFLVWVCAVAFAAVLALLITAAALDLPRPLAERLFGKSSRPAPVDPLNPMPADPDSKKGNIVAADGKSVYYSLSVLEARGFPVSSPVEGSRRDIAGNASLKANAMCQELGHGDNAAVRWTLRDEGRAIHDLTCRVDTHTITDKAWSTVKEQLAALGKEGYEPVSLRYTSDRKFQVDLERTGGTWVVRTVDGTEHNLGKWEEANPGYALVRNSIRPGKYLYAVGKMQIR